LDTKDGMKLDRTQDHVPDIEEQEEAADECKPEWMRGFNSFAWKKQYQLREDDWKFDKVPEIFNGQNIADFIDPDILQRLEELEKEEEEREAALLLNNNAMEDEEDDLDDEERALAQEIKQRKKLIAVRNRFKTPRNAPIMPRKWIKSTSDLEAYTSKLGDLGLDATAAGNRIRDRSRSRTRGRDVDNDGDNDGDDAEGSKKSMTPEMRARKRTRSRSLSVSAALEETMNRTSNKARRTLSQTPSPGSGLRDMKQKLQAELIAKKGIRKRNMQAKKGEGDRVILNMKPKHLYSGHRGIGKNDRR